MWQQVGRFSDGVSATHSLVEAYDASPRLELEAPAPLEGQRGVVVGLMGRALTLELFGTSTLFARHWEQFADSRFEARHLAPHLLGHTPGQAARDFAAALATDSHRLTAGPTRSHGNIASTPVRAAVGRFAYSGLAVQRPGSEPLSLT